MMAANPMPYTQLACTNRRVLAELVPLPMPLSLHIEPTNVCNFRCVSCPQSLPNYKQTAGYHQHMDLALYEKILRDVRDMGRLKALKLFGYGEPMLHPDLGRMVRMAHDMEVADRIEFTSNVACLDEKMARALIDGQLDYLRVSIYSLDQATHERFTHSHVRVERIYENLLRLRTLRDQAGSKKPFLYLKMFDFVTAEEAEQFRQKYRDIADEIALEIVHNMSGYRHIDRQLGINIPQRKPKQICPAPFFMSSVAANGDATVCCIDWSLSARVGNLRHETLRDIWFGKKLQAFRRITLEGRAARHQACCNCTWNWSHPDNLDDLTPEKKQAILDFYENHALAGDSQAGIGTSRQNPERSRP